MANQLNLFGLLREEEPPEEAARPRAPSPLPVAPAVRDLGAELEGEPSLPQSAEIAPPSPHRSLAEITETMSRALGGPVVVTLTNNRRVMLSARKREGILEIRMHRMFASAPDAMLVAILQYTAQRKKSAGRLIDAYVAAHRGEIDRKKRAVRIRTRGVFHDLQEIFDDLIPLFEEEMQGVSITWGRRKKRLKRQRAIQLGTYTPADLLIRVHPVLDQDWVPRWYISTVVHHEMLHHALPAVREGNRLRFHTPEFRRRERAFPHHDRAELWEKTYLRRLLQSM